MKDELRPRFLLEITIPSKNWTLDLVPSMTFTPTATVSPGANFGIFFPRRAISSFSNVSIIFAIIFIPFYYSKSCSCSLFISSSSRDSSLVNNFSSKRSGRLNQVSFNDSFNRQILIFS